VSGQDSDVVSRVNRRIQCGGGERKKLSLSFYLVLGALWDGKIEKGAASGLDQPKKPDENNRVEEIGKEKKGVSPRGSSNPRTWKRKSRI